MDEGKTSSLVIKSCQFATPTTVLQRFENRVNLNVQWTGGYSKETLA
jgi:hypothetical protein